MLRLCIGPCSVVITLTRSVTDMLTITVYMRQDLAQMHSYADIGSMLDQQDIALAHSEGLLASLSQQ